MRSLPYWSSPCPLVGYMLLVRSLRYRNLELIKHKYSFANDGYNYKDMSVETAQEIYRNIAAWDMPFAFEFGWIINFLKVRGTFRFTLTWFLVPGSCCLHMYLSAIASHFPLEASLSEHCDRIRRPATGSRLELSMFLKIIAKSGFVLSYSSFLFCSHIREAGGPGLIPAHSLHLSELR